MKSVSAPAHQLRTADTRRAAVREANFSDHEQITALLSNNRLETKSFEEWRDLWSANPAYRDAKGQWPIGWVLETEEKHVVGFLGNIPLVYILDGGLLTAAVTHSWAVDVQYRSYALLLLDHYFSQQNVDFYLSTTVNAFASQAFTALGSQRVPVGTWDQSLLWIGSYRGFSQSWLRMKRAPFPEILSALLAAALRLKTRSARRAVTLVRDIDRVEVCSGFDDRFDTFWEALSAKETGVLLGVRTREALNWHFRHAISQKKLWLVTLTKHSTLISYSVFLRQDNAQYGLKRVRLVDFQTLNNDSSDLLPMLAWAVLSCRERKIHMLEWVGAESGSVAAQLAPIQRTLPCWLYYYKAKGSSLAQNLENPHVWKPTAFDGDASL
jgi:hypothetical protein